jgi:hypothetical protein
MQSRLSQAEDLTVRLPQNTLGHTAVKLKLKRGVLVRRDHNQIGLFLPGDIQDRADRVSQSDAKRERDVTGQRSHPLKMFAAFADRRAIFVQQVRVGVAAGAIGRGQDMDHHEFGKLIAGNAAGEQESLIGLGGKVCRMQDDIECFHGRVLQTINCARKTNE